jgi:hypothetical protein
MMLNALENRLRDAIDAALPKKDTVLAGPYAPSGNGAVVVHARELSCAPPPVDSEAEEPAQRVVMTEWNGNGTKSDFVIPAALTGELMEVESPPGVTARAGDAYYVDDGTIRFYRAPAAGTVVRARLQGGPAAGWTRRRRCEIRLDVASWAQTVELADERLETALHMALAMLVDAPNFDAELVPDTEVWMRILAPRVWLVGINRGMHTTGLIHATAELLLRAELDEIVARGERAPVGVIGSIAGTVVANEDDPPEPFVVTAPDEPEPGT